MSNSDHSGRFRHIKDEPARVGYIFIDIDDPFCAWAAVRGVLTPAKYAGASIVPLSAWSVSLLTSKREGQAAREVELERVRAERYPELPSRFSAIFYFPDLTSAELAAAKWSLPKMRLSNRAEIGIDPLLPANRFDSNWITHPELQRDFSNWVDLYWQGSPAPDYDPIWESVIDEPVAIWTIELRNKAVEIVERNFPDAMAWLEIARAGAASGSSLGNIVAQAHMMPGRILIRYLMDVRDANNPDVLETLRQNIANPHVIARNEAKGFDTMPDFSARSFIVDL